MKTEIISDLNLLEYGEFLSKNKSSTFYHSVNHLNFLESQINSKPFFITVREQNKLIDVLPFLMKKTKFGKVVNSLPFFGSYGGLVGPLNTSKLILESFNEFNNENDILSSVIISNPFAEVSDLYEKYFDYTYVDNRLIQCMKFDNFSKDDLWNSFEQRVRRSIRKSINLNVKIEKTSLSEDVINDFYSMHKHEIESKNGKVKPIDFFINVKNNFEIHNDYDVFCAKIDNKPISYLLVFYFNQFTEYYMPAYDPQQKNTQSTSLLIWESLQTSLSKNMSYYNFGGTWPNQPELYRFKRGWNTIDFLYNYYIFCDVEQIKSIDKSDLMKEFSNFYVAPYNQIT